MNMTWAPALVSMNSIALIDCQVGTRCLQYVAQGSHTAMVLLPFPIFLAILAS